MQNAANKSTLTVEDVFQREKWSDEKRLREREIELRQREIDKSVWASPLFLAITAAVITAAASLYVSVDNSRQQRELEKLKAENARILEAIKTGNPDKAAENLRFMLDTGLIQSAETVIRLREDLSKRLPGKGPSLPAYSSPTWEIQNSDAYKYNSRSYQNPSVDYVEFGCKANDGGCNATQKPGQVK